MNFPKYTILIVEDDQSMRDTLEAILKTEYKIIMSANGMDATKKLKDNAVHIAIIDILLPDIKGTEVLKMIKKKYPDIECIMVSVVQDSETIVECIKNGACDYLTKEFDYDLLRHKIKNVSRLYKKKIQIKHLERRIHVLPFRL